MAQWCGRTLVRVGRLYPSSNTCWACFHRPESLPLAAQEWRCSECGAAHDRNLNAARSIEREGRQQLQQPEDTGEVLAFGGEGACPGALSAIRSGA